MRDPFDPTDAELRAWAQSGDFAPMEDWDLIIAEPLRAPTLIDLAADGPPESREFFLRCLYLLVGDAVRSGFNSAPKEDVEAVLVGAEPAARESVSIALWLARSRRLLEHPEEFQYDAWCGGGLARPQAR
ncbi:MAG TPA: hypothetical protein VF101_00650 [Gaiellaceae bacterium]